MQRPRPVLFYLGRVRGHAIDRTHTIAGMTYYGAREIAAAFRTVRRNTIQIAEEIPEDEYGFRATPDTRTVGQTLFHIGNSPRFALMLHRDSKLKTLEGFDFSSFMKSATEAEQQTYSKADILRKLSEGADEFASFVETLSDEYLAEVVAMPPGGTPPSRTRFDMLIAVKEHEMHHRGQLMLIERMLGIVPHLTRARQERIQAIEAARGQEA
jgi:uncharacterized damage-inducible protein DinB